MTAEPVEATRTPRQARSRPRPPPDTDKEDLLELLRVFNNNAVLARDAAGREVVLTGRGLGFQARTGQAVDMTKVVRTFVPDAGRNADNFAQLLASIPPEHIDLAALALDEVRADLDRELPSSTVVALADHLRFAIKRTRANIVVD